LHWLSSHTRPLQQSALVAQTPLGIMLQPHLPDWHENEQHSPWPEHVAPTGWHPGPGRVRPSEHAAAAASARAHTAIQLPRERSISPPNPKSLYSSIPTPTSIVHIPEPAVKIRSPIGSKNTEKRSSSA
jgi:hypothetical protein